MLAPLTVLPGTSNVPRLALVSATLATGLGDWVGVEDDGLGDGGELGGGVVAGVASQ